MAALYDIKALQKTLLELQHELPDSNLQLELQRLQNQLGELQRQPVQVTPRALVVQPVALAVEGLTDRESEVLNTFSRFVSALSQFRVERLADVAASLTMATYQPRRVK